MHDIVRVSIHLEVNISSNNDKFNGYVGKKVIQAGHEEN